jgi:hypothetical protein
MTVPLEIVKLVEGRLTTALFDDERVTTVSDTAFAGRPTSSRVSTNTFPAPFRFTRRVSGIGTTFRRVGRPLGVTVVI